MIQKEAFTPEMNWLFPIRSDSGCMTLEIARTKSLAPKKRKKNWQTVLMSNMKAPGSFRENSLHNRSLLKMNINVEARHASTTLKTFIAVMFISQLVPSSILKSPRAVQPTSQMHIPCGRQSLPFIEQAMSLVNEVQFIERF